jgi:hypothetical protein
LTAWLNGIYVAKAIASCFSKNSKYPQEPIDFTGSNTKNLSPAERFGALAATWNAQFINEHPESL